MNCLAYIVRNNIILNKVLLLFYFKILMYKWTDYTLNIKYYIFQKPMCACRCYINILINMEKKTEVYLCMHNLW
jgi:hypothetical protein